MFNFFKKFSLFLIIGLLLFPTAALAGTYQTDEGTVEYEGLVPCGKEVSLNGTQKEIPCQFCHLFVLINGILDFVWFRIVPPIAVILAIVAGFLFIFSQGDPKKISKSQEIGTSLAIGLLIVYGSWVIVNMFFTVLDIKSWTGLENGGWSQVNCQVEANPTYDAGDLDQDSCGDIASPSECEDRSDCEWTTSGCRVACPAIDNEAECNNRNDCNWTIDGACVKPPNPGGEAL